MNMLQIEYFLLLAKFRSFKRTAEELYVSQPAVSKQIAQLEKEWGIQLFVRKYKETALTQAGQIMYDALNQSRNDYQNALLQAQRTDSSIKTLLHIGVPERSEFANLFDVLSQFQADNSDVILNIESAPLANLVLERSGNYDMVICHEYNLGDMSNAETRVLAKRRHTVLISEKHPLVESNPDLDISQLVNQRVYVPAPEGTSLTVDYCRYICAHHGFTPQEVLLLPNVDSVLLATKMCFGVSVLDDLMIMPPENYHLKILPTDVYFNFNVAWRKDNNKPYLRELADMIKEQVQMEAS